MSRQWQDKEGPLQDPSPIDELDRRVRAVLARLDPDAAAVMQVQGRRELDRRAAARQHHADIRDASHAVAAAYFEQSGPAEAQAARQRIDRARAQLAAQPTRWEGREHMTDDDRAAWQREAWPDLPQQRTNDDTDVQEQIHE